MTSQSLAVQCRKLVYKTINNSKTVMSSGDPEAPGGDPITCRTLRRSLSHVPGLACPSPLSKRIEVRHSAADGTASPVRQPHDCAVRATAVGCSASPPGSRVRCKCQWPGKRALPSEPLPPSLSLLSLPAHGRSAVGSPQPCPPSAWLQAPHSTREHSQERVLWALHHSPL